VTVAMLNKLCRQNLLFRINFI